MTTIHDERPTRPLSAREFAECIVDTVREPLVVLGADLRVRSANRSFYRSFGVIPEETDGRLVYELGNGQWNIPGLRTLLEEILPRDHSFRDFEVDHVFEGLGRRRMILNARKLWREGNETEMILLAIEDVTDRWRAEDELRQRTAALEAADAHKNEFLAMLAHELRNPLAAISNAVAVSAHQDTKKDLDWSRSVISRQVGHLSRLIDDLLDISRITHNKIQLRKEIIDASPVLRQAVEAVRPLAEARNQELALSFTSPDLRLHADPMRLEQIVVNLLTNAAKYTPSGGHIQLVAGVEGKEVVIRVRDDGLGIPPEMLARVFDLFAQDDRSLARSEGGLGIGLTLVRSLVEMHGGTVTATSAGPGLGSEFVVRLPAAGGTTATRGPEASPHEGAGRALSGSSSSTTARTRPSGWQSS